MEASVPLAQAVPAGLLLDPKGAAWISSAPIVRTSAAGGELPAIPEELWAIVLEQCDAVSLSRLMAVSWSMRELLLLRSDQLWIQLESADGPPVPMGLRRRLLPRQLVIWQRVLGGLQAQAVALNVAYDKVRLQLQQQQKKHRSFGSQSAVRPPLPSCCASARAQAQRWGCVQAIARLTPSISGAWKAARAAASCQLPAPPQPAV